jgi:hypothetical protein
MRLTDAKPKSTVTPISLAEGEPPHAGYPRSGILP